MIGLRRLLGYLFVLQVFSCELLPLLPDYYTELNELSEQEPEVLNELALRLRRWEDRQLGRRSDPLVVAAEKGLSPKRSFWRLVGKAEGDYDEWRKKMGW